MTRLASQLLLGMAVVVFAASAFHAEGNGASFTATSANVSGAGEAIRINITEWSPDSKRDEFIAAWTLTAAPAAGARGGRGGGAAGRGGAGARGGGAGGAGRGARGAAGAASADTTAAAAAAPDLPPDPDAVDSGNAAARGARGGRGGAGAAAPTPESSLSAAIQKTTTVGILWTSENVGYSIKYAFRLPQPDGSEHIVLATDRRIGMWSNLWNPAPGITVTDYPFSIIELHINSKGDGDGRGVLTGKIAIDNATKTVALENYAGLPVILKGLKRQTLN
jgi:hypothetical protein